MNLQVPIKDIFGLPGKKSFPRNAEDAAKTETADNVILNALSVYPIRNKGEMFLINKIAQAILTSPDDVKLESNERDIVREALFEATYRTEGKEKKGVYLSHIILQVLEVLKVEKID